MKILITAGPTQEAIDPVRYISNHSSGKMGVAIATEFAERGNDVTLIKGPISIKASHPRIKEVSVVSAADMYEACTQYFTGSDVIVFAAAVADYAPKEKSETKLKKAGDTFTLELVKTKDIAGELGKLKKYNQTIVGFALETDNEEPNAIEKLKKKNFDIVVLNSMQDEGAGFKFDTNKITIIDKAGNVAKFGLKTKKEVAIDIVDYVYKLIADKKYT
jgi:phosphopantothenoylcysteine decarboxylase/phosphopantothenate--cysteine ligase